MLVIEPPSKLKHDLNTRYSMYKGTNFSPKGLERTISMLQNKEIPASIEFIYLYTIESMERKPHLFRKQIIIHDEAFADTINFLDQLYVGEDRSLVSWTIIGCAFAELLFVNAEPGLGLYIADQTYKYISQFKDEEGYYIRFIPLKEKYTSKSPIEKMQQELEVIAERKRNFMELQRFIVLYHEIGHAIFENDLVWNEIWKTLGPKYIENTFQFSEIANEVLSKSSTFSTDEYVKKSQKRVEDMTIEISCDWYAFACLILNKDFIKISLEDSIRAYWRFLLFCELVELLKKFAKEWSINNPNLNYQTDFTNFSIRIKSFVSILESPEQAIKTMSVTNANRIRKALESIDLNQLITEFKESFDLSRLIFSLGFWGTANPYLLKKGLKPEDIEELYNKFFNDSFLTFDRESDLTRKAPCFQSALDFLTISKGWATNFFANEDIYRQYSLKADKISITSAKSKLKKPYLDVTLHQARLKYIFLNY